MYKFNTGVGRPIGFTLLSGLFFIFLFFLGLGGTHAPDNVEAQENLIWGELTTAAEESGRVRVIVHLDVPEGDAAGLSSPSAVLTRMAEINRSQTDLTESLSAELPNEDVAVTADFKYIPFIGLSVTPEGLNALKNSPFVLSIEEDIPVPHALSSSGDVIGRPASTLQGFTGEGQAVAILDTGVDLTHPAFIDAQGNSRVVAEGCYSTTYAYYNSLSVCPGGSSASIAAGSGDDCEAAAAGYAGAISSCSHGTHVAGIAAGNDVDRPVVGVAPEADIIAIQVFSLFPTGTYCGGPDNCMLSYTSDQVLGLERVYALRNSFDIAAVNMSLGGGAYIDYCDYDENGYPDSRLAAMENLAAAGIATVVAAGNNGYYNAIGAPGCVAAAISVGATDDNDNIASYSNIGPQIDLLAPGSSIYAAIPGGGYGTKNGTSMATPQIAGAWAVLKGIDPTASVNSVLGAFTSTATLLDDGRTSGIETDMARINLFPAVNALSPGLTTQIEVDSAYLLPGDSVTVTLTVTNETALLATNVIVTGTLPAGFTLDPASLSGDAVYSGLTGGHTITWTTGLSLSNGQALTRQYVTTDNAENLIGSEATVALGASGGNLSRTGDLAKPIVVSEIHSCGFSEGFESGLGTVFYVETTNDGYVRPTPRIANSGSYAVMMDDKESSNGNSSEVRLILNLNLNQAIDPVLSFAWADLGDEFDTLYDGLFIRENKEAAWAKILDFDAPSNGIFITETIDLAAEASTAGIALTDQFQVKFGFYDNFGADLDDYSTSDGYALDDLALSCTYPVAAPPPQPLTAIDAVNDATPLPERLIDYTLVISGVDGITHTGVTADMSLPTALAMSGTPTREGGSGTVSNTPAALLTGGQLHAGEQMTLTVPLLVAEKLTGGTPLTIETEIYSNEYLTPTTAVLQLAVENGAPTVENETVYLTENGPVSVTPLSNDSDINGDSLIISAASTTAPGTLLFTDTTLVYTPTAAYKGSAPLSYTVSDQNGETAAGVATVVVPNTPPVAVNDLVTVTLNGSIGIVPTLNDDDLNGDELSLSTVGMPSLGDAVQLKNTIVYTADTGVATTVVMTYTLSDGDGGTDTGTISIVVTDSGTDTEENEENEGGESGSNPEEGPIVAETIPLDPGSPEEQEIETVDGKVDLKVPEGAVPNGGAEISYQALVTPTNPLPEQIQGVGVFLVLDLLDDNGDKIEDPVFDPPLQITVSYDPAQLNGVDPADLVLYYFNESTEKWVPISVTSRDSVNHTITASLSHFTDFALAEGFKTYIPYVEWGE